MRDERQGGVLQGIRVLDLTRVLSGPYCTLILADQGAEVVKIEEPGRGDDARHFGPPYAGPDSGLLRQHQPEQEEPCARSEAPGRTGAVSAAGRTCGRACRELPSWGHGSTGMRVLRVVEAQLSSCLLLDLRVRADRSLSRSAGVQLHGTGDERRDDALGRGGCTAVSFGIPVGDIPAGIYAATAIAMALYQRERTGPGQQIDISLFDALVSILEFPIVRYGLTGELPQGTGDRHPSITPYGVFRTQDDSIVIAVGSDPVWERLCRALGREDWLRDPRFATNADRTVHVDALQQEIEESLAQDRASVWIDRLLAESIPVAPINRVSDLFDDVHVRERGMLTTLEQPGIGAVTVAGTPIQWGQTGNRDHRAAPRLGEHTRQVLCDWLALTSDDVDRYAAAGAVAEL